MSFQEAQLSLQVLAELSYGSPERKAMYEAKAREDAAAAAAVAAIGGATP